MGDESSIRLSNLAFTGLGVNLRSLSDEFVNLLRRLIAVLLGNLEVVFHQLEWDAEEGFVLFFVVSEG